MTNSVTRPATSASLPGFINVSDWKLRTKLLIAFIIAAFVPLSIEAFTAIQASTQSLLAQGTTNLVTRSASTSNAIDQYLIAHREDIVSLSLLQSMVAYVTNPNDAQIKTNALKELKSLANKKYIESIAIMDFNGVVILSSSDADINTNVQFRPYFLEAMKGNAGYVSDPSVSVVTGQPAIFFSAPILDSGGNVRGAIRSRLSLSGIWDLVEADKDSAGPGTYGVLLDENGIRIASSLSLNNRDQIAGTLLYAAVMPVPSDIEKRWFPKNALAMQPPPPSAYCLYPRWQTH
jgi:C4-dicarboxylate-specific signal transduction histidine kinase